MVRLNLYLYILQFSREILRYLNFARVGDFHAKLSGSQFTYIPDSDGDILGVKIFDQRYQILAGDLGYFLELGR